MICGSKQLAVTLSDGMHVTKQCFVHVALVDTIKAALTYSIIEVTEGELLQKECYFLITKMEVIGSAKCHLVTPPSEKLVLLGLDWFQENYVKENITVPNMTPIRCRLRGAVRAVDGPVLKKPNCGPRCPICGRSFKSKQQLAKHQCK